MRHLKSPARWLKAPSPGDDTLCYFEADEDGCILRQVELHGPERTPVAAAALAEWPDVAVDGTGAVHEYVARFGGLADQPISNWDPDFPHEELSRDAFEKVWKAARSALERP